VHVLPQVASLLDKYGEYLQGENDNNTRIIREALDTHVQVVQLLLSHGADATITDKEGHTAEDFDFKPSQKERDEAPAGSKEEL